jgi:hypothetical protein
VNRPLLRWASIAPSSTRNRSRRRSSRQTCSAVS